MSIQSPSSSDPLITLTNPTENTPASQTERLALREVNTGLVQLPPELENEPPMKIILYLAREKNFTPEQIKNVHVSTCNEFNTPQREYPEGETVDTWKKDGQIFAKVPMNYKIEFNDGQRNLEIEFNQDYKAEVQVPIGGTRRQVEQFKQKIEAVAFGIRTEIQAPILSKDNKRITELAQEHLPQFKFQYGSKNYLNGKKITWNKREKLDQTNEKREIVGVEVDEKKIMRNMRYKGNIFNKIFQIWYNPYGILSEEQRDLLAGLSLPKDENGVLKKHCNRAPKYPSLEEYGKLRGECAECAKKSLEKLQSTSSHAATDRSTLQDFNLILGKMSNSSHRIDIETLARQEAKAAQEDILDIDDRLKELAHFKKKDNDKYDVEIKEYSRIAYLKNDNAKITEMQKQIDSKKATFQENRKILSDHRGKDTNGQDIIPLDTPINEKLHESLYKLYTDLAAAPNPDEKLVERVVQALEYTGNYIELAQKKDAYNKNRSELLSEVREIENLMEELDGRIATVTVLKNETSLVMNKDTKSSIKNLESLQKEKDYTKFKGQHKQLMKLIENVAPALPSDTSRNAPIELRDTGEVTNNTQ